MRFNFVPGRALRAWPPQATPMRVVEDGRVRKVRPGAKRPLKAAGWAGVECSVMNRSG